VIDQDQQKISHHDNFPDFSTLGFRFMACAADYQEAEVILFGAPWDGTASFRPGSRFGPAAMRLDSLSLETFSPYQNKELVTGKVCDIGDLELPMGGRAPSLAKIRSTVRQILTDGKKPVMIGGEHLVSLPAVTACHLQFPQLCVLHFDAHADLREEYLGETLSHATVMRRIWDELGDGRIWQFGIRSGTVEEFAFARDGHVAMRTFDCGSLADAVSAIGGRPVYLSIDLDVLDPSVFPGTGTPEPGGLSFQTLLDSLLRLSGLQIVAADLVELSPPYDTGGISTAVALKILRELLILI
jgi:agmatinase